jgi:photosystem II stability/assembly factor-like uncharacterized protein
MNESLPVNSPISPLKRLTIIIVCIVMVMPLTYQAKIVYAGDNIWTWAGVSGTIEQILTDPINPSIVYAATHNKIIKSTDGGNTWSDITDPSWIMVMDITMGLDNPNILYAIVNVDPSVLYRTIDGGTTWQLIHTEDQPRAITVSPTTWREAYLVSGEDRYKTVISKTIDGGQTWTAINDGLPIDHAIDRISIAPSAPHIMIAKTMWNAPNPPYPLYKSVDAGNSWSPLPGPYSNINVVTFDPKNSNTIYLGMTFSPGAWKTTDGGNTWQPLANGLQQRVYGFVINPDNTQVIHVANDAAGVLESQDGGQSWVPIDTGIQGLAVQSIGIASRDPLVIYAGLFSAGIWEMTRTNIQDYSITINNGALYTNEIGVTLTLTAPPGTTQMLLSNDGGFGGAIWESFTNTKLWNITSYGENVIPRTVYAKFMTNSTISGQYQDDIVLDQNPPTGTIEISDLIAKSKSSLTQIPINSPTIHSDTMTNKLHLPFISNYYTSGFRYVTLFLSALDDLSGVANMMISNEPAFSDSSWQEYSEQLGWFVNERGETTVYVKFQDRAGNESMIYSDSTTAP